MSPEQILDRPSHGLYLTPDPFEAPEGTLLEADNVAIDRPNLTSKVRGVNRYGTALASAASALGEFNETLIALDGTTLRYDSDGAGTWAALSGSYSPPDASTRMRFVEDLFNLYFTTDEGVKRLDALANAPADAGMPKGLEIEETLTGTGDDWFVPARQVGYRVAFLRVLGTDVEVIGDPGERRVLTNAYTTGLSWANAGTTVTVTHAAHGFSNGDLIYIKDAGDVNVPDGTYTIANVLAGAYDFTVSVAPTVPATLSDAKAFATSLETTIPDGVAAGDFLELYRTELSASASADPGGIYLKVIRQEISAADLVSGYATIVDDYDDAFLGEELYTNGTSEGGDQENSRPPYCKDMAAFKGYTFFANVRREHRIVLRLLTVDSLVDGTSSITITDGTTTRTYIFNATEDVANQKFQRVSSETTEAQNVRKTMESLVHVINRDSGQAVWYADHISGALDSPGRVQIRKRDYSTTALSFTADLSTTGDNFEPVLPTAGTTVSTVQDDTPNGLAMSKREQPDAVPQLSTDPIGSSRDAILRIVPLRDSLIIFTERHTHRLTGEDENSFNVRLLEANLRLLAPESAVRLNDSVHAFTTVGVAEVNENGSRSISFEAIDHELNKIITFGGYATITHAVAYENDRKYYLWTQTKSSDTVATVAWVWNYFTRKWTRRLKSCSAGIVMAEGDNLFLAHGVDTYVLKERKTYGIASSDYSDEDIPCTITAVGTAVDSLGRTVTTVTLTFSYETPTVDHLLSQGGLWARTTSLADNGASSWTLTLDSSQAFVNGAATLSLPIKSRIRWAPEVDGNAVANKCFNYCTLQVVADTVYEHKIGFLNDVIPEEAFLKTLIIAMAGWGMSAWGAEPWGGATSRKSTPIRVPIPRRYRRCRGLQVIYEHSRTRASFDISTVGLEKRMIGPRTTRGYG